MNNFKSLLTLSTAISLAVVFGFSSNLKAKTVWLEEEDFKTISQGDRDDVATEIIIEEKVSDEKEEMKKAAATPQEETIKDKDLPTLTAEGDFLLPTYILPESDESAAPEKIAKIDDQNPWRKKQSEQKATPAKKTTRSGVALKGISPELPQTSNGEKALLENIEKQYETTAALLANTEKRLAALEKGIESYSRNREFVEGEVVNTGVVEEECVEGEATEDDTKPRAPLLLPLAPLRTAPEAKEQADDDSNSLSAQANVKKDYVDFILDAIERTKAKRFNPSQSDEMILRSIPKEMRISFLPGSADLSSQAFKWVKVFSYNPQRTVGSAVEVRLSPRDLDLQSRRFALIKGALMSNGLTPRQIRFVFTDRDCDSVVLRDIQLPEHQEFLYQKGKNGKISQQIIQKW